MVPDESSPVASRKMPRPSGAENGDVIGEVPEMGTVKSVAKEHVPGGGPMPSPWGAEKGAGVPKKVPSRKAGFTTKGYVLLGSKAKSERELRRKS